MLFTSGNRIEARPPFTECTANTCRVERGDTFVGHDRVAMGASARRGDAPDLGESTTRDQDSICRKLHLDRIHV